MRRLAAEAKRQGVVLEVKEGGSHTKVSFGGKQTVVPRHTEVNERTAKSILKQMGVKP